ncbi:TetR family transcriptional regulator C-terminal domain-containing protein [Chitinophaga tropicalis]|uniref:TetR/AcrR family transcriptional regulator n=1 Tax=Chitinophaga tropicalis TaxID=2683588 RepID=A0A7K1U5C3_9BACT|nr:TetR family transcriptional regulator C-terminal domain-containing protein [Chitinophaga tropicalis]MVT09175.1 TetR/AcrR family transcriptional regulator [Chitinophaga tropicalis]
MDKKFIREAYKNYWLENGKRPVSVYAFCQLLALSETTFYDMYSSFDAVEKDLWLSFFQDTVDKLKEDETYRQYSAREKLLTFYFLWVQQLRENRSFILQQKENHRIPGLHLEKLETFRHAFYDYIRELIKEGYQTGEIKERKYISDQYVHGFWMQALFVLRYWTKDTSERFEMTDAAIEKAVNLSFQLISSNTIDSLLDFGKFMFAGKQ